LEQFTCFRQHINGSVCKEDYIPNQNVPRQSDNSGSYFLPARETSDRTASELAATLKAFQKQFLKGMISRAAESLNPAEPTEEQANRNIQLLSFTNLIEEDDDALYMMHDSDPLHQQALSYFLNIICHGQYVSGSRDQSPHIIGEDGISWSFSDMSRHLYD
jgi:hypothetical protein